MNSNNSKFKNLDELKAKMAAKSGGSASSGGFGGNAGGFGGGGFGGGGFSSKIPRRPQEEIIVEEVVEQRDPGKMFDYNMSQVDASLRPPKDNTKPIMVGVLVIVSLLFGAFIGWCWQGVLSDRGDIDKRIEVAKQAQNNIRPKIDKFQTLAQLFKQRSESLGAGVLEYNHDFYTNVIKAYTKDKDSFVLDISKELPQNSVVMATNALNNPLSDIRAYAAGTTLLSEIMESHVTQTEQDMDEINTLLGQSSATDRNIVYALKVNPIMMKELVTPQCDAYGECDKKFDRNLKSFVVTEVFQVKKAITDDVEASKVFQQLIDDGKLTPEQAKERTYSDASKPKKPAAAKGKNKGKAASEPVEITTDPDLLLPNRVMYYIVDNAGRQQVVFSDEIILIERRKLFAGSANALERYRKRMVQIIGLIGEIEKSTDGLYSRIHTIAVEEPL